MSIMADYNMKKYRVYFKQINATVYDVDAKNKSEAIQQARYLWIADNQAKFDSIQKI